ncbi:MAG: glycosyltransferase [Planctomycetaceae bacterium]
MRVLCVTNLFPNPLRPGKGIFNYRQLRLMSDRAPVRVLAPVPWTDDWHRIKQRRASFCNGRWREFDGVEVAYCRYFYTPKSFRSSYGSFLEWSLRRLFRRAVGEFKPDLVYACWAYPDGWAAWRLARQFDLPVVVKLHGSDLLLLDDFPGRKSRTIEMLKNADAIVSVGQTLRDRSVELGAPAERSFVVFEGTDNRHFCPGPRSVARSELKLAPEVPRLLFVGNLVPVKAVANLVEACRMLRREGLEFRADIVGDGPLRNSLERQIAEQGLAEHVTLRGQRSPAELPQWYRAADLVVLPSESEGIPNVLVEAAACGTPFVATRVGGISEIAHLTPAELIPPRNPVALARAIRNLLNNSGDGNGCRQAVQVPSLRDGVERTLEIFSDVLSARELHHPAASNA